MASPPDERGAVATSRVGSVLKDKWRLDHLVGVGGMAAVYAATHRNGKRVAIKVLHRDYSLDAEVRARFLREGYLVNKVMHPGVVGVLDDDAADDGAAFLVMELCEGETFEHRRVRKGGKLPPAEVLSVADQVLDVLVAAHAVGVVHRDLKPENLFLCKDGTVKLLDFGIARLRELSGKPGATLSGGTTTMGTPAFMPPEQARGDWAAVDGRSDLWALGASLFSLLTGKLVHEAPNVGQLLVAALTQKAPKLGAVLPGAPVELARVVDGALEFEQSARWPEARAMQAAVREAYRAVLGKPAPDTSLIGTFDGPRPFAIPQARAEEPAPRPSEKLSEAKTEPRARVAADTAQPSPRQVLEASSPVLPFVQVQQAAKPRRSAARVAVLLIAGGLVSASLGSVALVMFVRWRAAEANAARSLDAAGVSSTAPESSASASASRAQPAPNGSAR